MIKQYFKLQGLELPEFPRPDNLETTPSIYLREAMALGFKEVPLDDRQPGDVLIMRLGTQHPMHAAILVDYQQILHQRQDSLSAVESLRQYHIDRVAAVFRYAAGRPTAG